MPARDGASDRFMLMSYNLTCNYISRFGKKKKGGVIQLTILIQLQFLYNHREIFSENVSAEKPIAYSKH